MFPAHNLVLGMVMPEHFGKITSHIHTVFAKHYGWMGCNAEVVFTIKNFHNVYK